MKTGLKPRIVKALAQAQAATEKKRFPACLPGIIAVLEQMSRGGKLKAAERGDVAGELLSLLLQAGKFSNTPLGKSLFRLADDFAE
jgi:hypothetical protein